LDNGSVKEAAEEMVSLVDESAAFWRLRAELFQVWVSAIAGDRRAMLDKLLWAGRQEDISRAPYYEFEAKLYRLRAELLLRSAQLR
jgi:hypothetical protein